MGEKGKPRRISWSMLALLGFAGAGDVATFATESGQAQTAIQITTCAGLAGVIVLRLHRASDVVDAALRLAEEMARLGRERPDGGQRPSRDEADSWAPVIPLPSPRAAVGHGSETAWRKDHL